MKKIFAMLAVVTLVWGCSKMDEVAQEATYTLTGFSSVETRTDFGTPGTNSIPFLWSAGDYVFVGDTKSNKITEGGSSATFTVNGSAPQNGKPVYFNRGYAGVVAKAANTALIHSSQSTNNTLGENGDFGYATVENGSFTLKHATSYFWFNVEALPAGYTLDAIHFTAAGGTVAGMTEWDGSKFGPIIESGSSSIELEVGDNWEVGEMLAMVVLPVNINSATVTYELSKDGETKYYEQTLGAKNLEQGKTYRVSINLANKVAEFKDYMLRVLTFEDSDVAFSEYSLVDGSSYEETPISMWSDLIPAPEYQYGSFQMYGSQAGMGCADYWWCDDGNTGLGNVTSVYGYASGGHAISKFFVNSYESEDRDDLIAKFYGDDYVKNVQASLPEGQRDSALGWFLLQLSVYDAGGSKIAGSGGRGHNGSDNFAVQFGYKDLETPEGKPICLCHYLPYLGFIDSEKYYNKVYNWDNMYGGANWDEIIGDGTYYKDPQVIDHMYVTNTAYTLNQLLGGVKSEDGNTFGGNYTKPTAKTWYKIVATGFDENMEKTGSVEFYLYKDLTPVTEWTKWDLSELGEVVKVEFNLVGSPDMSGKFGLTMPAYFAYDDVAVRVKK
ncbi:MAG: DUF4465 domain-containing protein [Alistipes sp.]|nr:DUF4465 domain-containing protein [Alistipes sp.]